ncbi:AMP-binding protein [Portibacter lacus]|uniref:AMP-binding protein n=1 Tax=Portibacter lacus TaxID=1099794 RepID=UPI001F490176|nr:AMP-binding protein [Portibacter lacus]
MVSIFFQAAESHPDHIAISHKEEVITYDDLSINVQTIANYLSQKGIRKGTKVLVFIPMSIKLYETVLALFSLGAIVVFVDEWADRARMKKALEVVPVDVVIAPRKFLWLAYLISPYRSINRKLSIPKKLRPISFAAEKVNINDTALITFTTGSTGLPKAANRTHHFLAEQFRILKFEIGARPEDVALVTLPIVLLSILGTGATGVIPVFNQKKPEEMDVEGLVRSLTKDRVTMIIGSPYFVERLADGKKEKTDIRKVLTGGAPVFPDVAVKIQTAFQEAECMVAYGSTEAEPISTIAMKDIVVNVNGLGVGNPHPEIQLKIIRMTDDEIKLDAEGWGKWEEAFGEIIVKGPHVLVSYYNSDEAFRLNKIKDGDRIWHRTGDSGRLVDGALYLNGRCSQLIKSDEGYQSLFIIEYQLSKVAGVAIGTFMNGVIVLELRDEAIESEVRAAVSGFHLGEQSIRIVDRIPRDPRHFSKIDYARVLAIM